MSGDSKRDAADKDLAQKIAFWLVALPISTLIVLIFLGLLVRATIAVWETIL